MTTMSGLGVSLRVTCYFSQGGRSYMEDMRTIAYHNDLDYAFFGIFDGHGGAQAATFAKEHLLNYIVNQSNFWSSKDEDVLKAIRDGFIATHYAMWKVSTEWPKNIKGFHCPSGCTATVVFIMNGKAYVGHVGDSALVLGFQENGKKKWKAESLTTAHKPNSKKEKKRIEQCGSKVVKKCGVYRVVWSRPVLDHPVAEGDSPPFEDIPFLAVARSLGDFWSYNAALDQFVVSPDPDVLVYPLDVTTVRCLILGTDGLWDMLSAKRAITIVQDTDTYNNTQNNEWFNPSKKLVEKALKRWASTKFTADNTSAITLLVDRPTPPKTQVEFKLMSKCQGKDLTVAERESYTPTLPTEDVARCRFSLKRMAPIEDLVFSMEHCNGIKKLKKGSKSESTAVPAKIQIPRLGRMSRRRRKKMKVTVPTLIDGEQEASSENGKRNITLNNIIESFNK